MKVNSSLSRDNNHIAIQAGNAFQTKDNTGTPLTSPLTVATTQTLVVPPGAIKLICIATTAAVRISEVANVANYLICPVGVVVTFDVTNMANVYALQDAAGGILQFAFVYI